ncbi:MAG TPA: hypothetical protein GXZ32_06850 [Clostridiales bacterium]|jgi:hypothetical protein|nr:hypothetical protein [Clostridiales bacterium]
MGNCKYCGQPAGFLRKKHKDCEAAYNKGIEKIHGAIESCLSDNRSINDALEEVRDIAKNSYISEGEFPTVVKRGWEGAVEHAFEDGVLTEEEEQRLSAMAEAIGFDKEELYTNPAYNKLVKGAVIREVLEGKIPERFKVSGALPFNFLKSERLVWVFQSAEYYEMRTYREYVGRSRGFSIRIAKGVYYRTGGFRGRPVETQKMVHVDTGLLGITNSHIYFSGSKKRFRIKYNKIVSFEPFSNGIGVFRDAKTAKPQYFLIDDGWFLYNLVTNLARL